MEQRKSNMELLRIISILMIISFHCAEYQSSPFLLFYILKVSMIIFIVGVGVDLFRQILEKYTINKILDLHIFI